MKPRLFVLLFIAALLLVLAAACGDDDGDESDEDAIRNTIQETITACNAGDSERVNELETATSTANCPRLAPNDVEVLSVTADGDEATAEIILTDNEGEETEFIVILRKEDGRWLVHQVN